MSTTISSKTKGNHTIFTPTTGGLINEYINNYYFQEIRITMSFKLFCAFVLLSASSINALQIQAECNFLSREGSRIHPQTTNALHCSLTRLDNNQKWSLSSTGFKNGYVWGCDSSSWFCFEMDPNAPNWTSGYACSKKQTVWDNSMKKSSCGDGCTEIYNNVVFEWDC